MKYDLIFYLSKKTAYCEKRLRMMLSSIGGELRQVSSAREPVALGERVCESLRICPLAVIVGGLRSADDDNLSVVLSRVVSNSGLTPENIRRLSSDSGAAGYIIRCKRQILLALPDEPDDIESMLGEDLLRYLKDKITG